MNKFIAPLILFTGEVVSIAAEVYGAKFFGIDMHNFKGVFWRLVVPISIGAWLLLCGYMLSMAAFKNIWVVSVISITSILIAEPIIDYAITGQLPTRGALIGLIFGVLGFIAALFL
jgi:hypothetical protein